MNKVLAIYARGCLIATQGWFLTKKFLTHDVLSDQGIIKSCPWPRMRQRALPTPEFGFVSTAFTKIGIAVSMQSPPQRASKRRRSLFTDFLVTALTAPVMRFAGGDIQPPIQAL